MRIALSGVVKNAGVLAAALYYSLIVFSNFHLKDISICMLQSRVRVPTVSPVNTSYFQILFYFINSIIICYSITKSFSNSYCRVSS